jgi:hypothetical protein
MPRKAKVVSVTEVKETEGLTKEEVRKAVSGLLIGMPPAFVARKLGRTVKEIEQNDEIFAEWYDQVENFALGYKMAAEAGDKDAVTAMKALMPFIAGWHEARLEALKPAPTYVSVLVGINYQEKDKPNVIVDRPKDLTPEEWVLEYNKRLLLEEQKLLEEEGH